MITLNFLKSTTLPFKKIIPILLVLLFVGAAGYLGLDYYKTQKELSEFQGNAEAVAIKEKNDLLKKVGRIALLPQDEDPTIATVTDAFKLKGQKFFSQAENDDKVIIFPKAQRAILYRPGLNKVIESAPISIQDMEGTVSRTDLAQDPDGSVIEEEVLGEGTGETSVVIEKKPEKIEPEEPAKLAIYNGTLFIEGLATKVGAYLVKEIPGNTILVEILQNADEVYEETIIIDVTQKYHDVAEEIREVLSGKIVETPTDVDFPDVDIVIIAGLDISGKDLE